MSICVPRFSWRCCSKKQKDRGPVYMKIRWEICSLGVPSTGKREVEALDYSFPLKHAYLVQAQFYFTVSLWIPFLCLVRAGACSLAFLFKFCQIILITEVTACRPGLSCFAMSCSAEEPPFPSQGKQHQICSQDTVQWAFISACTYQQTTPIKWGIFLDNRIRW